MDVKTEKAQFKDTKSIFMNIGQKCEYLLSGKTIFLQFLFSRFVYILKKNMADFIEYSRNFNFYLPDEPPPPMAYRLV